jgi:O-antigen/teichoic acid export membrane protein
MSQDSTLPQNTLRRQGIGLTIGLALQYCLGMITNLFVEFPDTTNENTLWHAAWSHLPLALHIILGLFLLIGSVSLLIRSIKQKNKRWTTAALIGFVAILAAMMSGSLFVGSQKDVYSLSMALAFIVAVLAYLWGIITA